MTTIVSGIAGSGKTTRLLALAQTAARSGPAFLTSPNECSLDALARRCADGTLAVLRLRDIAIDILRDRHEERGIRGSLEIIDDVRAALLFEEAATPLLQLEWAELIAAEIDPEVPGLRAPRRFLDSAFRLIRKLRDALITPEQFLRTALTGATQFYAQPPNFAHAELLQYTKEQYRDSLDVSANELQRQYRREIDLAKVLAKLYQSYLDLLVHKGCLSIHDAIAEAATLLADEPGYAKSLAQRYGSAFIDDAQELTMAEQTLLARLYGDDYNGVTFAVDQASTISGFAGARPDRLLSIQGERIELEEQHRCAPGIDRAARHLAGQPPGVMAGEGGITLFRASTKRAEAQFVAEYVVDLLDGGAPAAQIALLFRSVDNVRAYEEALLERNVPAIAAGDVNLFEQPVALDALALLWNAYDPFRHDYLLRTLSGPAFNLSDSSLYTLCSDPPDAQQSLFAEDGSAESGTRSGGRWDAKRDIRLGWNLTRGTQDAQLSELALERVRRFRELREGWVQAMRTLPLPNLARHIWSEGLAALDRPGSARYIHQQATLGRLYDRICAYAASHPGCGLGEFLADAQERAQSVFEASETSRCTGAVRLMSIDAAYGQSFEHVILPAARAGSFPRWYVPDSFLYSPSLGMIAKENVGEANAARTAKFSYYMYRAKTREAYNREEQRAFVYALRRASKSVLVTASERATKGLSAPEFLAQLQASRLPGIDDLSDRWRPKNSVYRPEAAELVAQ